MRLIGSDCELLAAERAIDEFRCGRAIAVVGGPVVSAYASIETVSPQSASGLQAIGRDELALILSCERAVALGMEGAPPDSAFAVPLLPGTTLIDMVKLATSAPGDIEAGQFPVLPILAAAEVDRLIIQLLKVAWLLPAALRVTAPPTQIAGIEGLMSGRVLHSVSAEGLARLFLNLDRNVVKVSEARIPLADAADARFVCFRTSVGHREHLAVIIGTPDEADGVPVRLHSACLTGDVFGSLRCDCGDQLRQSVAALGALGGGVLLYLAQEGRGIGLANKLRAYALQDTGRDTIDADLQLGFSPDERQYGVAAAMLRELGYDRIRLMTNNPEKIDALISAGIQIVCRLPLLASITPQNQRYMDAKRTRARHLLDPAQG
jgi:GTP cyclohydrolase II